MTFMNIIKSEKISYTYPVYSTDEDKKEETIKPLPALSGIDFEISKGDFICILGRNGSGKSTLARHLNALLVPDEGTLWINGMDTKNEDVIKDIRTCVGMVFQNPDNQIIASVVEEDVAFGLENIGVPSQEIRERVDEAIKNVGMADYAKSSPNRLSGGQKQRVAVAGILAMSPECIVLDEATAMLDPKGRAEVMDTARRLNKEKNITLIAITHYMDEALCADKVFVMDKGKIKLSGPPKEVFRQADLIEELGLKLPEICIIANKLRKAGLPIPEGVMHEEELKEAILSAAGERKIFDPAKAETENKGI